jgi:hypothetical protein
MNTTKSLMAVAAFALVFGNSAQAQIGWKLERCRKHLGRELSWTLDADDPTERTFGINFQPHRDGVRGFEGRLLFLGFDPDGTVGKIKWWKWGGPFSAEELSALLKKASAVAWHPVPVLNEYEDARWIGEQDGKIIFDALEDNTGTGGWFLTITTR